MGQQEDGVSGCCQPQLRCAVALELAHEAQGFACMAVVSQHACGEKEAGAAGAGGKTAAPAAQRDLPVACGEIEALMYVCV